MSSIKNITKSLTDTLKQSDLKGLTSEYGEVFLDSFLADGIAKDIPILNSIVAAFKTSVAVKDMMFTKKIVYFLTQINEVPAEERDKVISEIDDSEEYRIKIGEKLLYILDKCDDHEKAELTGIMFKAFLQRKIDYSDFLLCNMVIEKSMITDLEIFVLDEVIDYNVEEYSEYLNWGLVNFAPYNIEIQRKNTSSVEPEYELRGSDLSLTTSNAGDIIRTVLKKYVTESSLDGNLYQLSKSEIKTRLEEFLKKYSYGKLWQVKAVCIAELCRNSTITNEDFDEYVNYLVEDRIGSLKHYEKFIQRYKKRMEKENIVFNSQMWQDYYSKLFTSQGHG